MMENEYAKSMKSFFGKLDRDWETNPTKLAIAFANHFWNGQKSHQFQKVSLPKDNLYNVSVLARETSLSYLTKRIPLVADATVITHHREEAHEFWSFYEERGPDYNNHPQHTKCYIRCPNLVELGVWLKDCRDLLLSGDVFYYPDILIERQEDNRYYDEYGEVEPQEASIDSFCELIVQNKKIIDLGSGPTVKSQLIRSVLELDLPYIENTDLETFSKITSDQKESIQRFRNFLRLKFLDLTENEGAIHFDSNLAKIGLEIQDGVRALNSDYKMIGRKAAFQATGATIAATTATLVAVNSAAFGALPPILGTSGGIWAMANVLVQYLSEKQKLQDAPYFYLWLLEKKT
jgi:hypothetical protein